MCCGVVPGPANGERCPESLRFGNARRVPSKHSRRPSGMPFRSMPLRHSRAQRSSRIAARPAPVQYLLLFVRPPLIGGLFVSPYPVDDRTRYPLSSAGQTKFRNLRRPYDDYARPGQALLPSKHRSLAIQVGRLHLFDLRFASGADYSARSPRTIGGIA